MARRRSLQARTPDPIEPPSKELLALLPPALRNDVATALAYWLAGYSILSASRATGVNPGTIWRWTHRLPGLRARRADYAKVAEDTIMPVLMEAWRRTGERLTTDEEISTRDLAIIGGIAADRIANFRRIEQPKEQDSPLSRVLERLAQTGGSATLTIETTKVVDADENA